MNARNEAIFRQVKSISLLGLSLAFAAPISARADENLKPFLGRWAAVSQACVPGSILIISETEIRYAEDAAPKKVSLKDSKPGSIWLEDTAASACVKNCESPFYHLEAGSAPGAITVSTSDTFSLSSQESGKATCEYQASRPAKKKTKRKA